MLTTHAVGIDLGTTYSCIGYLNEHGSPVTLANQEGELSTPSVVMFDGNEVIIGTEALRNAVSRPQNVVQNSKRHMGDSGHSWSINGRKYSPIDIATCILKKMLSAAQEQIGQIDEAVITVPAQFSDFQRHATIEAGHRAGLQRVDIINEPVAAALCYVLGSEGLWFTELADEQKILVYDLGGGTFDLSLVRYQKDEVSVIASSGDLELGGIDWSNTLRDAIAGQFAKEFGDDPRSDPESLQFLTLEAEQTKRSLTVRPKAAITCQHAGNRKTYQVEQSQFEKLTKPLLQRTSDITKRLLRDNKMGWAHVDVVLSTGGSSRMPMIRTKLKEMSGTTLNTALSPDQSIAHGATYYAGMLLTNKKFAKSILNEEATSRLAKVKQRSVNARGLGIMIRDMKTGKRVPHYLIPANTPLPTSITHHFGTVTDNQKRVFLQIVESGTSDDKPPAKLGECVIDKLPPKLREGSEIAVMISYDSQARVHVSAKDVTSGREAHTEIVRQENLVSQLEKLEDKPVGKDTDFSMLKSAASDVQASPKASPEVSPASPKVSPASQATNRPRKPVESAAVASKQPPKLSQTKVTSTPKPKTPPPTATVSNSRTAKSSKPAVGKKPGLRAAPKPRPIPPPLPGGGTAESEAPQKTAQHRAVKRPGAIPPPISDDEILELD